LLRFLQQLPKMVKRIKRIAAFLFLWFLEKNGALYKPDNTRRLSDNALVALTLMIAESRPEQRDTIIKVVVNLINRKNSTPARNFNFPLPQSLYLLSSARTVRKQARRSAGRRHQSGAGGASFRGQYGREGAVKRAMQKIRRRA